MTLNSDVSHEVMLTRNLWTSVGLCNGTLGKVLHIIYKDNDCPPSLPIAIIVQLEEGYTGPILCKNIPNCVPITPVPAISNTLGSDYERLQLPLRFAWPITYIVGIVIFLCLSKIYLSSFT